MTKRVTKIINTIINAINRINVIITLHNAAPAIKPKGINSKINHVINNAINIAIAITNNNIEKKYLKNKSINQKKINLDD